MIDRVGRMTIGGTVAAGMVRGVLEFAVARGAPAAELLHECGLSRALLADADARVALPSYIALVHAAKRRLSCEALALQFGESMSLADLSVVGMLSDTAPTMREGIARMNRYALLLTDAGTPNSAHADAQSDRFAVVTEGADTWFIDRRPTFADFPEQVEITFAFITATMRRYAQHPGDRFVLEARFTHAMPSYTDEYARVLRVPVSFGQPRNALRIDATWLDRPLGRQPAWAGDILAAHADRQLQRLRAGGTLQERVRALVRCALEAARTPDADTVARALHMSRATLARQLRQEGTSFTTLVSDCRRALAEEYLVQRAVSVKETAYRLGFSDPAAFSRAYKRWTGLAPAHARARGA